MLRRMLGPVAALALVFALGCDEGPDDEDVASAPTCTEDRGCPEGSVCVQGLYCQSTGVPAPDVVIIPGPTIGADGGSEQDDAGALDRDGALPDGGIEPRSDGGTCVGAQLACGDVCVDPRSDALNCGGCGIACTGGRSCNAGVCCDAVGQVCGDTCVDLTADSANCGACGLVCPAGTECSLGACVTPLPGGSI